jgi:hypothetical protein
VVGLGIIDVNPLALNYLVTHAGFLRDLFLDPEDGGETFFRNIGSLLNML